MLNKGAFALEIVRGDPELTADCRVTLNRGDRIGSLDCIPKSCSSFLEGALM